MSTATPRWRRRCRSSSRPGRRFIPVVTIAGEGEPPELWGALHHVDALKAFNRALAATAAEEHS